MGRWARLLLTVLAPTLLGGCPVWDGDLSGTFDVEAGGHAGADDVFGCGLGTCGPECEECDEGELCHALRCCAPLCDGRKCGTDGCGGVCGECGASERCEKGTCVPEGRRYLGPCLVETDFDGDGDYERAETRTYEDGLLVRGDVFWSDRTGESAFERHEFEHDDDGRLVRHVMDIGADGVADLADIYQYDDLGRLAMRGRDEDMDGDFDALWSYVFDGPSSLEPSGAVHTSERGGAPDGRLTYQYSADGSDRVATIWERPGESGWEPFVTYRFTYDLFHNLERQTIDRGSDGSIDGQCRFGYGCWELLVPAGFGR